MTAKTIVSAPTTTSTSATTAAGGAPADDIATGGRRQKFPFWLAVWGIVFVCSWCGNQFSPLLVMYEDQQHYSSFLVNALLGVYVLGLAPALLIAGPLSDRYGRKPLMLAGVATAVIGSGLLALGHFGPMFIAFGRLFSGFTIGIAMAVGNSWIKELSQAPHDPRASLTAGARRASLAFTLGSAGGALIAGLLAQWGPLPDVTPFLVHVVVAVPFALLVLRIPETQRPDPTAPSAPTHWWQDLRIPSAGHKRFVRVVLVTAPWIFGSAAIAYGYLPTQLRGATGDWGLVFATAATVIALGVSSAIQPIAKRVHSMESARGLATAMVLFACGIALVWLAIGQQSVTIGIISNVVVGAGIGIALVSGLVEVQRIATDDDLAGLTGVFYAAAYLGFLSPMVIAAVAAMVPVSVIFAVIVAAAFVSWGFVLASSRKHIPAPRTITETAE